MGTGAHPRGTNLLPQVSLLFFYFFPFFPHILFFSNFLYVCLFVFLSPSHPSFLSLSLFSPSLILSCFYVPAHFIRFFFFTSIHTYIFIDFSKFFEDVYEIWLVKINGILVNALKVSSINVSFMLPDPLRALHENEKIGREYRHRFDIFL